MTVFEIAAGIALGLWLFVLSIVCGVGVAYALTRITTKE